MQHTWTPFSTLYLFHLRNVLMEPLSCSSEMFQCFQGKISSRNAKNEVAVTCYTAWHRMMKLASAQFHNNFPRFRGLWRFCRRTKLRSLCERVSAAWHSYWASHFLSTACRSRHIHVDGPILSCVAATIARAGVRHTACVGTHDRAVIGYSGKFPQNSKY